MASAPPGLVLRKCACGGSAGPLGECEECKKKRLDLKSRSGFPQGRALTGEGDDEGATESAAAPPEETAAPAEESAPTTADASEPAPAEEAESETSPEQGSTGPTLLVEDDAEEVGAGQMRKSEFLGELRTSVRAAADEALAPTGRSSDNCPFLDFWFGYYGRQSGQFLERAIHKYVPESTVATAARDYIEGVTQRIRRGVERWAQTGEVTEVPEGVPTGVPTGASNGGEGGGAGGGAATGEVVRFKKRAGGAGQETSPAEVQAKLGEGRRLEGGTESRMSSAFGADFSRVRVHTDSTAGRLSNRFDARAFTVGEHVAFASGEYQPGTLIGDALLAHELAHVVQQRGMDSAAPQALQAPQAKADGEIGALETDADNAAVGAMVSLWSRGKAGLKDVAANALPRLKSGLQLQRCPCEATKPAPKLGKKDHPLLTAETQDCGGASWGITWVLSGQKKATEGWIVQKVEQTFDVKDCDNQPIDVLARTKELVKRKFAPTKTSGPVTRETDPKWWPFSEAWRVRDNDIFMGKTGHVHQADVYTVTPMGSFPDLPETKGTVDIQGTAEYFDCLDLPSDFKTGQDPIPALPLARPPASLSGGTGSIAHNLKIEWDCCKPEKKTKIVSKT